MIAEQRDNTDAKSQVINTYMKYLRSECDDQSLFDPDMVAAIKDRLFMSGRQLNAKNGLHLTDMQLKQYADTAISRFISNWKDKTPGEDDRGHRLGKMATTDQSRFNVVKNPGSYRY